MCCGPFASACLQWNEMKRETSGTKGTHHITSRNSCVFCLLVVFFICSSLFCSFVMKSTNRTNRTNKTQNQNLDVKVEWKEKRTSERMKRARVRAFPLVSLHSTSLCSFFFHSSLSSSFIGLFVMDWKTWNEWSINNYWDFLVYTVNCFLLRLVRR